MAKMLRRRFLAAMGVLGLGVSARPALAANCVVQDLSGGYFDPHPVYRIGAKQAQFALPAEINAIVQDGAKVTLAAAPKKGGTGVSGTALIRAEMTRESTADTLAIKIVSFEWPVTVLDRDGDYNTIVGMAYEQNIPVGLRLWSEDVELGTVGLSQDSYPHDSTTYGFTGDAAGTVHDALMTGKKFVLELVAGGTVFSRLELPANVYPEFVAETVIPEMNRVTQLDADGGCEIDSSDYNSGGEYYGAPCFLTTACCSVVGLADDCWELTMLRRLRDGWMAGFANGQADIARYEQNAPAIAKRLGASAEGRRRLLRLYWSVIVPAAVMIGLGMRRAPYRLYRKMMLSLGA